MAELTTSATKGKKVKAASRLLPLVGALPLLVGCAYAFPNTAEMIYPKGASLDDLGLGLLADIEMWVEQVGGWIAFLFGV